jgi:phage terminase small subunit
METITTKVKKLPKLTKKQRGFVKDYLKNENGTQAALNNYDIESTNPEKVASVIAAENLAKPSIIQTIEIVRETLKSALEKEGITPDYIAKKVNVLLKAKDREGNPDINGIDKGLKHAKDIYGVEDKEEKASTTNTYNFIFNAETQAEIKEMENKIKAKLIQPNV